MPLLKFALLEMMMMMEVQINLSKIDKINIKLPKEKIKKYQFIKKD